MSRLTVVFALLGFVLGGASLRIATDVSRANAAELRRSEAARDELEQSFLSMGKQIAALRSDLIELGGRLGSEALRSAVLPVEDAAAVPAAEPGPVGAAAPRAGPPSDVINLTQRYRTLSDDAKRDALEDLLERARWGDEEALRLVLEGLNDANPELRAKAAKMLGDLADPGLFDHLKRAASDASAEVRGAVAESLDRLPAKDAGPVLIGMLRDPDPDVVGKAIKSLAKLDYREARPFLTDQLASDDLEVATRAAAALRGMGNESIVQGTIDRIMTDYARADAELRMRAVKWLRRVGGATAIAHLRTIMESDPSLSVREEARTALVKLGA